MAWCGFVSLALMPNMTKLMQQKFKHDGHQTN